MALSRRWNLYEPQGGVSLALRQHARLIDPGTVSCASVYRAVREYRCKYPDKAVVYNGSTIRVPRNAMNWAIFMAGALLPKFRRLMNYRFMRRLLLFLL